MAYLLILSVQPCRDSLLPRDGQGHVIQKVAHIDQSPSDSRDESNDECSPFCVCSCCGINPVPTIVFSVPVTIPKGHEIAPQVFPQYTTPYQLTHSYSIWQPPKA